MRRWVLIALVAVAGCGGGNEVRATATATATVASALPGATAQPACAAAGDYWPTMTLALDGTTAWVACKEESRIESLTGEQVQLGGQAIAVLAAFDAVWALDGRGVLHRVGGRKLDLDARAPYNLWAGAGSIWAIDDAGGEVIRVDPETNAVVKRIAVGDGPADMVFDGDDAWVINHRDRKLVQIDTRTNRPRTLATIDADAPERIARLDGSLWITGRGTDLLRVDPRTGAVKDTIEIGGSGIDVVAAGGALWVPSRSEAVDQSGLPTMEALRRVTPDGQVQTVSAPTAKTDIHGLTADATYVWLADTTAGFVYRFPLAG